MLRQQQHFCMIEPQIQYIKAIVAKTSTGVVLVARTVFEGCKSKIQVSTRIFRVPCGLLEILSKFESSVIATVSRIRGVAD